MKHLAIAGILMLTAAAAQADPLEGVWKTQPDDGKFAHVTIAPCGAMLCGVISKTYEASGAEYNSENKGKRIVIDMAPQGGGKYEGKVWRPSNNKVYLGKMTLNGNSVKLQGCVAGGLICSSQQWARVR